MRDIIFDLIYTLLPLLVVITSLSISIKVSDRVRKKTSSRLSFSIVYIISGYLIYSSTSYIYSVVQCNYSVWMAESQIMYFTPCANESSVGILNSMMLLVFSIMIFSSLIYKIIGFEKTLK